MRIWNLTVVKYHLIAHTHTNVTVPSKNKYRLKTICPLSRSAPLRLCSFCSDSSGMQSMDVQVPDTITTWVANGFAMSSVYGMGVSSQTRLKAFQPFFVQMTLPYSVIRGEEIPITVTVFNYLSSCVPVSLLVL